MDVKNNQNGTHNHLLDETSNINEELIYSSGKVEIPWYKTLRFKLYLTYFDCFMFVSDILSDWYLLLFVYLWDGDFLKAGLTFSILLYSAILVGYINRNVIEEFDRFYKVVPLLIFNLTPLVHEIKKAKTIKDGINKNKLKLDGDETFYKLAASYRFAEVFTEALPQLVLQLSFVYCSHISGELEFNFAFYVQFISMHLSLFEAVTTIFKSLDNIHGHVACMPLMARIYFIAIALVFYPEYMICAIFTHLTFFSFQFWCYWSHEKGTIDSIVMGLICAFDPTILHRFSFFTDAIVIIEDVTMTYLIINNKDKVFVEISMTLCFCVLSTIVRIIIVIFNMKTFKLCQKFVKKCNIKF